MTASTTSQSNKLKNIALKIGKSLLVALFWLTVWVIIAKAVGIELLFPSPVSVFKALTSLVVTPDFWKVTMLSLLRVTCGISISVVLGCALAYLCTVSKIVDALLSPIVSIAKATPIASFIMVAYLWLKSSFSLPIFITSLIVTPIVMANISEGIRSVDKGLIEVAGVYKLSPIKKFFKLYVPSILPYFIAACKSSLAMAWKASVAAEVLSPTRNSIGEELYLSKSWLDSSSVFAWTLVTIVLSVIIEKLVILVLNRISKHWRYGK